MSDEWVKHNKEENQTEVAVVENVGIYDPVPKPIEKPSDQDTDDSTPKKEEIE